MTSTMASDMDKQLEDLAKTIRAMERMKKAHPQMFESQKVGIERMLADPEQAEYLKAVAKEIVETYIEDKNHHGEAIEADMMEALYGTIEEGEMGFGCTDELYDLMSKELDKDDDV